MELFKYVQWKWVTLTFIVLLVLQTLLNFAWVWVYSHFIETGGDQVFYEQYIFENRFGVNAFIVWPLYFLGAWQLGKKAGIRPLTQAMVLFGIHFVFGLVSELTMGDLLEYFWGFFILTLGAFLAIWLGGKQAQKAILTD